MPGPGPLHNGYDWPKNLDFLTPHVLDKCKDKDKERVDVFLKCSALVFQVLISDPL
jgi:hypothetical protein